MSNFSKKITGIENSNKASQEMRDKMISEALDKEDLGNISLANKLRICAECEHLKEEFKIANQTIKENTPVCGECGCLLDIKMKIGLFKCPLGRW